MPDGKYDVRLWYAGMRTEPPPQPVSFGPNEQKSLAFQIGNK